MELLLLLSLFVLPKSWFPTVAWVLFVFIVGLCCITVLGISYGIRLGLLVKVRNRLPWSYVITAAIADCVILYVVSRQYPQHILLLVFGTMFFTILVASLLNSTRVKEQPNLSLQLVTLRLDFTPTGLILVLRFVDTVGRCWTAIFTDGEFHLQVNDREATAEEREIFFNVEKGLDEAFEQIRKLVSK